ncbi:MAG: hypothetical protein KGY99_04990 [Phycisphaerae bacterium]|nr:hypothetical protein [Phycisphaerae bacterium]
MRQLAWKVAVMGFFGLALAGMVTGQEALTCTVRAVAGAVVLFVLVKLAGRVLALVLADALSHHRRRPGPEQERSE